MDIGVVPTRRPRHVNQHNQDEVPADFYREFEEQKRTVNELMQKEVSREQMYNKMHKFIEDMQVGSIPQAKKGPIIGYTQGGPSMFPTQASTSLFEERRKAHPSMYRRSPYMDLPPTTVLPKQRGDKSMNKRRNANVSPFNLGNAFVDDNVGADDILITDVRQTDN
nr:hypothetical protein [Tanacetum cinerariifolium]